MKNFLLVLMMLLCAESAYSYAKTPKIHLAPGQLCSVEDKDFDHFRYKEQIPYCRRNVTPKRKDKICALYGVKTRRERQKYYTVDHIIPLFAGGSNSDKNLWCQHKAIYTGNLERWYYEQLRDGKMRQVDVVLGLLSHKYDPIGKDYVPTKPHPLEQEDNACHLEPDEPEFEL